MQAPDTFYFFLPAPRIPRSTGTRLARPGAYAPRRRATISVRCARTGANPAAAYARGSPRTGGLGPSHRLLAQGAINSARFIQTPGSAAGKESDKRRKRAFSRSTRIPDMFRSRTVTTSTENAGSKARIKFFRISRHGNRKEKRLAKCEPFFSATRPAARA